MKDFYKVIPCVSGIFLQDDNVLLGVQGDSINKPYPGRFDLPGGKIKPDETPYSCLVREMKEKTGFDIIKADILGVHHNLENNDSSNGQSALCIGYKILDYKGNFDPKELMNLKFYSYDEFKSFNFTPWTYYYLKKLGYNLLK